MTVVSGQYGLNEYHDVDKKCYWNIYLYHANIGRNLDFMSHKFCNHSFGQQNVSKMIKQYDQVISKSINDYIDLSSGPKPLSL